MCIRDSPGTDPYAGKSLTIESVGSSSHTATDATYNPTTGEMVVTSANHNFEAPTTFTPTAAVYNPTSGIVTLTMNGHGLDNGDFIKIADNALKFTCAQDGNTAEKTYPRSTDPASGASLPVSNVTANTLDVQILAITPSTNTTAHTFVSAVPNSISNGGDYIQFADDSLTFSCALGGAGVHTYVGGTAVAAIDVTGAGNKDVTGATYDPGTGILVLTSVGHGLTTSDTIKIAANSLDFTCDKDSHATTHTYPRSTDPIYNTATAITAVTTDTISINVGVATAGKSYPRKGYDDASGKWLYITAVTANTFTINVGGAGDATSGPHNFVSATAGGIKKQDGTLTVNVGAAEATVKAPTAAAYVPSTGIMTLTMTSHGLSNGQKIRIAKESLKFTCAQDSNTATKLYPRESDPVYGKDISVTVVDADNVSVQVLASTPSTNTTSHVFTGLNDKLTATGAAYNAATGIMTITSNAHGLVAGERVKIADNSIRMTCAMDGNVSEKTYPRTTDPTRNKWIPISNVTTNTFDVQVGKSPLKSYTPKTVNYNPTTGIMEMTIGAHSYVAGDNVKIAKESLIFTCAEDGNATEHAYPRASDPFNDKAFVVTGVTSTTISVQVLSSQPSTNTTAHTFVYALPNAVTAGGDYDHTFVSATNEGITRAVVTIGDQYSHTFVKASLNAVEYTPNSAHTWISAKSNCVASYPDRAHQFIRAMAGGIEKQSGTITVNVGASGPGDQYAHTWTGGTAVGAVTSGGNYAHTFESAKTNSVHKTFSVAGNRTYHAQDCVDDVRDLLEAIADLSLIHISEPTRPY